MKSADYLQLRVELLEVKDPPWREFLIRADTTFHALHLAIQDACGWEDCHLYAFQKSLRGPIIAGIPDDEFGQHIPDAQRTEVAQVMPGASKVFYQYDFGDDWWHEVSVIDVKSLKSRQHRKLLGGERAFPPEDCGGIPGYEECVAVKQGDSGGPGAKELLAWLGDWGPEQFDLKAARAEFDW